jgi:hypothetical protein
VADDFGDGFFFVERRDLDNQLHGISPQVRVVIIPVSRGYRLQVTGYRLQVTGYRLQVTGW